MHTQAHDDPVPGRILVIDDEESIRMALSRALRRLGFEVQVADSGGAGLQAVADSPPNVILLDLRMPGIDGHTFLRRLGATDTTAAVVAMSGFGTMDDVVDVLRSGAIDFLKKPWTAADLMSAVTRGMETNERRERVKAGQPREADAPDAHEAAPEAPAPATEAPPPEDSAFAEILVRLRRGELPLPAMSTVLMSLRTLVRQPATELSVIALKIEQDQRLASDVLRLANAAHFARLGRTANVHAAVTRLGLRQVHNLVETLFLKAFTTGGEGAAANALVDVWHHAVARALTMRALAEVTSGACTFTPDTAYLSGLMADMGAALLLWIRSERRSDAIASGPDAVAAKVVTRYHAQLGAALLERWRFDASVVATAMQHHQTTPPSSNAMEWHVTALAGALTPDLVGTPDPTGVVTSQSADRASSAAALHLDRAVIDRLMGQLRVEYASIVQSMK